ncbi:MAG TPA: hypothetical protein VF911_03725 [Thermoanaerobaculia bacterium]|jgi:hypothetical protein
MRQMNLVGRGVLAVAVVMMLATPAEAKTNDGGATWSGAAREQLVKIVKKVKGVVRTFGDGLSDPKP